MASEKTKHFDNVASLEAIVSGLDPANLKSIHTGKQIEKNGSRADLSELDIDSEDVDLEAVGNSMAVVNERSGEVASIVSNQYDKLDHTEAFRPMIQAIRDLGISVEGEVREHKNGNRVIIEAQFSNNSLEIQDDSEYLLGFNAINTYDKSSGFRISPYGKRLICSNGLMIEGVLSVGSVSRVHKGEMDVVDEYKEFLENMMEISDEFRELVTDSMEKHLENIPVVLRNVGIPEGRVDDIMAELEEDEPEKVSRHQLWNSITSYTTHQLKGEVSYQTERRYQKSGLKVLRMSKEKLEREPEVEE